MLLTHVQRLDFCIWTKGTLGELKNIWNGQGIAIHVTEKECKTRVSRSDFALTSPFPALFTIPIG